MDPNKHLWVKFHIHARDNLPFSSWLEGANRHHLAEVFAELGYTKGAEIGVRSGRYSQVLMDKNPNLELLCIDPWAAYLRVDQDKQERHFQHCQNRLKGYKVTLMKMTSMEGLNHVDDNSLDFVYIDGRHEFNFVIMDLIGWSKKVKSGGIVSGHDYYNFYQGGIVPAVNAYTQAHNISQWYITKEVEPSFFWVKP